ncbi:hypothetical protein RJ639_019196 [Escallonia herrerae]|uniref:Uncharacterized protein n=1 Tax=Escallonia herrerae TaxID=1293975 RepID=A0AA89AHS9_9ASTE|nr:hypothetical protein RJ639_019196 [Escallonia herrerae]
MREIEGLKSIGYLKNFIKVGDVRSNCKGKNLKKQDEGPLKDFPVTNTISSCPRFSRPSINTRKAYAGQIDVYITNHVLVNTDSFVDIIFDEAFSKMGISKESVKLVSYLFMALLELEVSQKGSSLPWPGYKKNSTLENLRYCDATNFRSSATSANASTSEIDFTVRVDDGMMTLGCGSNAHVSNSSPQKSPGPMRHELKNPSSEKTLDNTLAFKDFPVLSVSFSPFLELVPDICVPSILYFTLIKSPLNVENFANSGSS